GRRRSPVWRPPVPAGRLLPRLLPPGSWVSCGSYQSPRDLGELPPGVPKKHLSARTSKWDNICKDPKINDATQEPVNCTNYTAYVQCFPAPNIICKDFGGNETHFTGSEVGFFKPISCRNVNGYSYKVAVALSLFLGWLGADRFYLGYPALEISAFYLDLYPCYFGNRNYFFQEKIVGPSDGSSYIIDYYGTRLTRLSITNETFRKTQSYP
uniref:TM2 domain containing 1 n=1 Tax=Capra hircus TaxID=9925 RepID=A0A8C2N4W3_CAPHI